MVRRLRYRPRRCRRPPRPRAGHGVRGRRPDRTGPRRGGRSARTAARRPGPGRRRHPTQRPPRRGRGPAGRHSGDAGEPGERPGPAPRAGRDERPRRRRGRPCSSGARTACAWPRTTGTTSSRWSTSPPVASSRATTRTVRSQGRAVLPDQPARIQSGRPHARRRRPDIRVDSPRAPRRPDPGPAAHATRASPALAGPVAGRRLLCRRAVPRRLVHAPVTSQRLTSMGVPDRARTLVWDLTHLARRPSVIDVPVTDYFDRMALSPDGSRVYLSSPVAAYSTRSGQRLWRLPGKGTWQPMDLSADGRRLAVISGATRTRSRVVDTRRGSVVRTLTGAPTSMTSTSPMTGVRSPP